MIDIEKTREALHTLYIGNPNDVEEEYKTVKTELERLQQKETPMKPILGINHKGRLDCHCRNCSRDVLLDEKYCSHCGQALDWSQE